MKTLCIAGIDEAGRGPLAGPVTAACVVLPPRYRNSEIRDSKQLTALRREELFEEIRTCALAHAVVSVGARRIEQLNILEATRVAMTLAAVRVRAALGAGVTIHYLIDGNMSLRPQISQQTIVKGDAKIIAIGAASILAKVCRDRIMERLDERFPAYGFASHKGYAAQDHLSKLAEHGPCRAHRRTFLNVREFFATPEPEQLTLLECGSP